MGEVESNAHSSSIREEDDEDDLKLSGCNALPCCDPNRAAHRFTVLIFLCFLSFGKIKLRLFVSYLQFANLQTITSNNMLLRIIWDK